MDAVVIVWRRDAAIRGLIFWKTVTMGILMEGMAAMKIVLLRNVEMINWILASNAMMEIKTLVMDALIAVSKFVETILSISGSSVMTITG